MQTVVGVQVRVLCTLLNGVTLSGKPMNFKNKKLVQKFEFHTDYSTNI